MKQGIDTERFEYFFREYHAFLCLTAFQIVRDEDIAKDIVQEFFISLWQNREKTVILSSFQAYAAKAVRNMSLQYHKKTDNKLSAEESLIKVVVEDSPFKEYSTISNDIRLQEIIEQLPLARREIFLDYVIGGHSYADIASDLNISVNTVKTQMKRAYSFLKENISKDEFTLILISILLCTT